MVFAFKPKCLSDIPETVYFGTFVDAPVLGELNICAKTAVGVNRDGVITWIEKNLERPILDVASEKFGIEKSKLHIVDISGVQTKFFFPGFIDTHIHAPQFPNNGIFGSTTLLDWLNVYTFPLEANFSSLDFARDVYEAVIKETLRCGTTTCVYYGTLHTEATELLADQALMLGQRAYIGKCCMTENSPDYYIESEEDAKAGTLAVIKHMEEADPSGELVAPVVTPRFAPSCSYDLLNWLGDLRAKGDYHCQTHMDENLNEVKWVSEVFPKSTSYAGVYADANILGPKTIVGHCIWLTDEERDLLKETGANVSHCPTSNSSISSGECRVRWLLDSGVNVSLGTDCSGGFTASLLEVVRHAVLVGNHLSVRTRDEHNKISFKDALHLGTVGGAKALGIYDRVGSFEVGKQFDAQLIDLESQDSSVHVFHHQLPQWDAIDLKDSLHRFNDIIGKWVFTGDNRNVIRVYVNGRLVRFRA